MSLFVRHYLTCWASLRPSPLVKSGGTVGLRKRGNLVNLATLFHVRGYLKIWARVYTFTSCSSPRYWRFPAVEKKPVRVSISSDLVSVPVVFVGELASGIV